MKSCSCPKYMWSAMLVGILCATVTESLPPNFDAIEQRHSYIMYYCSLVPRPPFNTARGGSGNETSTTANQDSCIWKPMLS